MLESTGKGVDVSASRPMVNRAESVFVECVLSVWLSPFKRSVTTSVSDWKPDDSGYRRFRRRRDYRRPRVVDEDRDDGGYRCSLPVACPPASDSEIVG